MTLEEYQAEYERLFSWRAAWTALAAKLEPGRLQVRQEAIERRARIADNKIRRLMLAFDREQCAPYLNDIKAFVAAAPAYRQDIYDRFETPGRTNSSLISDAIAELLRDGVLKRSSGPCTVHKGPLLALA